MRTSTPLWLLVATGALPLTMGPAARAADPSQWTCESCPFESGTRAEVDAGVGYVTEDAAKFGDYTGLDEKGAFGILGGTVRHRGKDGYYANFSASDLGLDTRSLSGDAGREGRYGLRLGYAEIPHHLADSVRSPFLGIGGPALTLPPGFPADSTAAMPLAATLQPVDLEFKRSRLDLGATLEGPAGWQFRADARRDVRDGTTRSAGSFFSTTSQLVAPLDQTTDQVEVSAAYAGRSLQASVAYHASLFRNADDALGWQNPFTPVVAGATTGQLALAPDNEFHEIVGTAGYQLAPAWRASGEIAVGRMTQNQAFLAPTTNPGLALPALPAASLDGRADTLDATVRLTGTPTEAVRMAASLTRNERDNKTRSLVYPTVSTDMLVGDPRANLPYSFTRDRAKLEADWRGKGWKLAGGIDYDALQRTLQETDKTRETSVWARLAAQPQESLGLAAKLWHGRRNNDGYANLASATPQNPLMRKYNQADRQRDQMELRADWAVREGMSLGFNLDVAQDDYTESFIGLTDARTTTFGADYSAALSEATQLRLYGQSERVKSTVAGSQQFAQPDWKGRTEDEVDTLGVGLTHLAMKGKLQLGGDLTFARSRSDTFMLFGSFRSPFPATRTSLDRLQFTAQWHQSPKLTLLGSLVYEHYDAQDWHLDGVGPGTVPNLLAFGEQPPHYHVGVIRFALRYRY